SGGVLLDEHWDAALGDGDAAHCTEVPELGAYLRQESRQFDVVLIIAGQDGATVCELSVTPDRERRENEGVHVAGDNDEEINKPRRGAYSHNQIRRRVDEIIKDHARSVADFVDRLVTDNAPDAVVLPGEVQGRTVVKAELSASSAKTMRPPSLPSPTGATPTMPPLRSFWPERCKAEPSSRPNSPPEPRRCCPRSPRAETMMKVPKRPSTWQSGPW